MQSLHYIRSHVWSRDWAKENEATVISEPGPQVIGMKLRDQQSFVHRASAPLLHAIPSRICRN